MRTLFWTCVLIALSACATRPSGTVFRAVPWGTAIPQYNVDSVTRDSASNRVYALVGTVVDSASGKPLEGVQILLRLPLNGRVSYALTDSRGGFVLGRVPPGRYEMTIRRLGYYALHGTRDARASAVDTLRVTMALASLWLQVTTSAR
jgi:hypothetical protein